MSVSRVRGPLCLSWNILFSEFGGSDCMCSQYLEMDLYVFHK